MNSVTAAPFLSSTPSATTTRTVGSLSQLIEQFRVHQKSRYLERRRMPYRVNVVRVTVTYPGEPPRSSSRDRALVDINNLGHMTISHGAETIALVILDSRSRSGLPTLVPDTNGHHDVIVTSTDPTFDITLEFKNLVQASNFVVRATTRVVSRTIQEELLSSDTGSGGDSTDEPEPGQLEGLAVAPGEPLRAIAAAYGVAVAEAGIPEEEPVNFAEPLNVAGALEVVEGEEGAVEPEVDEGAGDGGERKLISNKRPRLE